VCSFRLRGDDEECEWPTISTGWFHRKSSSRDSAGVRLDHVGLCYWLENGAFALRPAYSYSEFAKRYIKSKEGLGRTVARKNDPPSPFFLRSYGRGRGITVNVVPAFLSRENERDGTRMSRAATNGKRRFIFFHSQICHRLLRACPAKRRKTCVNISQGDEWRSAAVETNLRIARGLIYDYANARNMKKVQWYFRGGFYRWFLLKEMRILLTQPGYVWLTLWDFDE